MYVVNEAGSSRRCVRVSRLPGGIVELDDHGSFTIRTLPNALRYVTTLSVDSMRHEVSTGTGPASMSDGALSSIRERAGRECSKRRRSVRGLTKAISNGSTGSRSYSVPGNSFDGARAKPRSIF